MKSKLLLLLPILLLASCGNTTASEKVDYNQDVNDIYEAIELLSGAHNYTLQTYIYQGGNSESYNVIYTNDYVFCDYEGAEEGYIQSKKGVYRVNNYNEKLVSSELYLDNDGNAIKSLWGSSLFSSISDFSLSHFEEAKGQSNYFITTKVERIAFLNIIDVDVEYLSTISSFKVSLSGKKLHTLSFSMEFNNGVLFDIDVADVGSSSNSKVKDFIKNGGTYFTPCNDLAKTKELFMLDNYKRVCYEDDIPSNDVIGYEWFTPEYFFGDYTKAEYEIYEAGYISLPNKKYVGDVEQYKTVSYNGAYRFNLDSNYNLSYFLYQAPAFVLKISNMSEIMNYPSNMIMFDYNLQFFDLMEEKDNGRNVYVTTDYYIIQDWIKNFQISFGDVEASIYDLRIIVDTYTETPQYDTITFQFDYVVDGKVYGLQREFVDFGNSNIESVDNFLKDFEDK